jgi:hypothetical protein
MPTGGGSSCAGSRNYLFVPLSREWRWQTELRPEARLAVTKGTGDIESLGIIPLSLRLNLSAVTKPGRQPYSVSRIPEIEMK